MAVRFLDEPEGQQQPAQANRVRFLDEEPTSTGVRFLDEEQPSTGVRFLDEPPAPSPLAQAAVGQMGLGDEPERFGVLEEHRPPSPVRQFGRALSAGAQGLAAIPLDIAAADIESGGGIREGLVPALTGPPDLGDNPLIAGLGRKLGIDFKRPDFLDDLSRILPKKDGKGLKEFAVEALRARSDAIETRIAEDPDLQLVDVSLSEAPFTKVAQVVGQTAPLSVSAIAAGVATRSPIVPALIFGAVEGATTFEEAREKGASLTKAKFLSQLSSQFAIATERVPFDLLFTGKTGAKVLDNLFKSVRGNLLGRVSTQAVAEATQEFVQELGNNLIAKFGFDPARKITDNLLEAVIAAPFFAAGSEVAVSASKIRQQQQQTPAEATASEAAQQEAASRETPLRQQPPAIPAPSAELDSGARVSPEVDQLQSDSPAVDAPLSDDQQQQLVDRAGIPASDAALLEETPIQTEQRLAAEDLVIDPEIQKAADGGGLDAADLQRDLNFAEERARIERLRQRVNNQRIRVDDSAFELRRQEELVAEGATDQTAPPPYTGTPEFDNDSTQNIEDKQTEAPPPLSKEFADLNFSEPTRKVLDQMAKNEKAFNDLDKKGRLPLYDRFASAFVDVAAPIKRRLARNSLGQRAVEMLDLAAGAPSESRRQFEATQKRIDKILTPRGRQLFGQYLQSMRVVEVAAIDDAKMSDLRKSPDFQEDAIKHPGGLTAEEHLQALRELEEVFPDDMQAVKAAAQEFYAATREQVRQKHEAGLINTELKDFLLDVHKYYVPRFFVQHLDTKATFVDKGGQVVTVQDSGVKPLDRGSEQALATNPEFLLANTIMRSQSRVFKNRANMALLDYVRANPSNDVGASIEQPVRRNPDTGRLEFAKKPPSGMTRIQAFDNGTPVNILVPNALARTWTLSDPKLDRDAATWLKWVSGSNIVRPLATGINPEFGLSNIVRDLAHAWFSTQEYSPFVPIAWAQQATDMAAVATDAFRRKGRAIDYIREGGGMDFMTHQGQPGRSEFRSKKRLTNIMRSVYDVAGYLNETSEMWTRLALRERAIRNGATPAEATRIARTYIDFAQGGSFIKAVDKVIPYLNAGVQGTRGVMRSFKTDPAGASFKAAQIGAFSAGLAFFTQMLRPELWDSLDDKEKTTKWIIPLWRALDVERPDGTVRHAYLAIPKDQGQRLFAAIGEELSARSLRGFGDGGRVVDAGTDILPVNAASFLPPTMSAFLGYVYNKDFWRNEDIWRGREVSPAEEYWNQTPKSAVMWGQATGLSPERSRAAFGKVVPYNPYTWLGNAAWDAFVPQGRPELDKIAREEISKIPGIRRFMRFTRDFPLTDREAEKATGAGISLTYEDGKPRPAKIVRKEMQVKVDEVNDVRQRNDRAIDQLVAQIKVGNQTRKDLKPLLLSLDANEAESKRLISRFQKRMNRQ